MAVVRPAELPLVVVRIEGVSPAAGTWFALVFLVIGIGLATRPSVS
ncbi:MAG TPA: hypothetical protein VHH34_05820 [Pseudonocardiaceae bacterium]|nr:hypothetical protein [Pseudonocardiaceae bacterium]